MAGMSKTSLGTALAALLYMTFVPRLPTEGGFTLSHWENIFRPYVITKVIPNTAIVGVGTVLVKPA